MNKRRVIAMTIALLTALVLLGACYSFDREFDYAEQGKVRGRATYAEGR